MDEIAEEMFAAVWIDRRSGEVLAAEVVTEGIGIGRLAALYTELVGEGAMPFITIWLRLSSPLRLRAITSTR